MKMRRVFFLLAVLMLLPLLCGASSNREPATHIYLSDEETRVEGEGAAAYGRVVTVYSGGTYILSGELHGQLIVDTSKSNGDVTLVLDNAKLSFPEGPALWIEKAMSCSLVQQEGTVNEISTEGKGACAIYADEQLSMEGAGSLTIRSADGDGVYCRKKFSIRGGVLSVEADQRGLYTRKDLTIDGGELMVSAGRKGLSAKDSMTISGGKIQILAGGDGVSVGKRGDQYREGQGILTVSGGEICIDAYKAPIDAWGGMTVLGGRFFGTGRTDKRQGVSPNSTQAVLIKACGGAPGERVWVEDPEGGVLAEARPQYAYDLMVLTDPSILRGIQYSLMSPGASSWVKAE